MFKYIISIFSPSWDGDGVEGRTIEYCGTNRAKALNAWRHAKNEISPNMEVIVLGREDEHYDRQEQYDQYDEEADFFEEW